MLKGEAIKLALKKILGSAAAGGFKGWLIKYLATELFEEVVEPLLRGLSRWGMLGVDKTTGALRWRSLQKAKEEGDREEYRRHIGDV